MSISGLSIKRPVAVAMLFCAVVLLGAISFTRLPIDLLPDVSYPRLVVYTSYPEVAPAEMERLVTRLVESQVATVPGIERVTSVSRSGVSLVTLRFAWGTNMDFAMLNVRERLDNARGAFPETAARPRILRVDPESEPIILLSVAGPDLWETKQLAENVFRRRLEQLDGVAQALVTGGFDREIAIEVDPTLLEAYNINIQQIALAVDRANHAAPGGQILEGSRLYPLRTLGEFRSVGEIADVIVARQRSPGGGAGRTVYVRDMGRVIDGFAAREALARYNGHEAVGILLFKEAGANTVHVGRAVDEVLETLRGEFPVVEIDVAYSQAGFIADSIDNVVYALILGGMLAFLVLFLFLRQPRYPFAVALAIPISVVVTFGLMHAAGVSLNIMSLGGLALGVGMLVDNSIIVLENIFRHREGGADQQAGAARGAEEVAGAITAATLTTVAVFLPIIYVEGVAGQLFRDVSLAVAFSLLASLLVALTLLPSLAARFRLGAAPAIGGPGRLIRRPRPAGKLRAMGWFFRDVIWALPAWLLRAAWALGRELLRFWARGVGRVFGTIFGPPLRAFDLAFARFARRYHALLDWSLDHRARVLFVTALAFGGALLLATLLDRDLLPRVDQGSFDVRLELPEGTALARTDQVTQAIERVLLADPDVEAVFSQVGRDMRALAADEDATGLHTAKMQVRVREGAATSDVVARMREPVRLAADIGTVAIQQGQATTLGMLLGGSDADIAVRIRGEDLDLAFDYADNVIARLAGLERIANVRIGAERGQPQVEVEVLRDRAANHRLELAAVANAIEQGMRGVKATDFSAFDRKIPVMVRLPDELRYDIRTLERLRLAGVPLGELVHIEHTLGPSEVRREDQGRVLTVFADVRTGGLDRAILNVESALAALPPPEELRVDVGGENEEMRRSFRDLGFAFLLALVLVYMILAAKFESFVHPFTILAAVPLALVGALLALYLTGQGLNTMSLIGAVVLIGIVVNDSIVKVDFIVQARARGEALRAAILEAGRVRLRPIIMTTATTVLGLTPMALGIGRGADLRAPLAIAVIGGLIVATALTLIVVPVIFSVFESARVAVLGEADDVATEAAGRGEASRPSGAMTAAESLP